MQNYTYFLTPTLKWVDAYGEVKPVLFDRVIDKNLIKVYKYNSQLIKNI